MKGWFQNNEQQMTIEDAERIFTRGNLIFEDTKVFFDGNGTYHSVKNEEPQSGTYKFVRLSDKVYLRTDPPIHLNQKDLEITICLEGLPIKITNEN